MGRFPSVISYDETGIIHVSNSYIVKPVYKALQVLECLGAAQRELSLTEICQRVRLPKTTVFRYLYTLSEAGFVTHDPQTDLYRIGLRVWELGQLNGGRLQLRESALPFMQELRVRFNETVNLGVLQDHEVVYIEMVESQHSLRMQAKLGSHDPVYSTALGKAMLAFMDSEQWPYHLPSQLVAYTSRTITSLDALQDELQKTRSRGYAVDNAENEEGASCVGAPIFDQRGRVTAAISISAPSSRLNDQLEQAVADAVRQTAAAISSRLGFRSGYAAVPSAHEWSRD